ncbi:MAG: tRNA 2-thiouridine(34) synthase MnmA [Actinobacteria bacterium]|nr:tRNA 2-thiouridine(34) synthase MnmA [Actinomycetota bacterium]
MRVFVAMSGGVDSSVAAALMVEAGHEVTGVTMQLLPSGDGVGQCCGTDAVYSAKRVCDSLGIPHYTLDFRDVFEQEVIQPFVSEYAAGNTPNPCIACNGRVKFSDLLARVMAQGADTLVTGHYAQIVRDEGGCWVERGVDRTKDQSYFLYQLQSPALEHVAFPLGDMAKVDVRAKAASLGLPTASRADSQEICFVERQGISRFVQERVPGSVCPGPIVDGRGKQLGVHRGLPLYTVGQRKGLGIASASPLYVLAINASSNTLVVGPKSELLRPEVYLGEPVWLLPKDTAKVQVQTRYRMDPVPATARRTEDGIMIEFDQPTFAVAYGQAVVCYQDDRVVAGGVARCRS